MKKTDCNFYGRTSGLTLKFAKHGSRGKNKLLPFFVVDDKLKLNLLLIF